MTEGLMFIVAVVGWIRVAMNVAPATKLDESQRSCDATMTVSLWGFAATVCTIVLLGGVL